MKKVFGLLAVVALMTSCSDDDSSSVTVSEATLSTGKWYYSSSKYSALGQGVDQAYEHQCASSKDYIMFADGVFSDSYHDSGCDEYVDTAAYTISGKTVTVDYGDGDTETYTVTALSSTKLVLETSYTESGMTVKYTDTYTSN
ncbi:lipocalin family protein [Flavobacterium sp. RHBU_3]|uniref:lipocalin family protein n=1 Tax=Flavobacterium sp. RHBU_3 TaxID=3391184 RepID=UPI00398495A6